ncbi:uncharacterized protein LOC134224391 [Armigeres subalbatus]|uniref:uncharacterized protein LOC134224391 n=1 Tax=Armigeres subalbatus TaxID=124917 RepID=UPI002ED65D43
MQDALRKNREPRKFCYSSGKTVEVRMIIAGSNIRYVRVFDLPPEIPDEDLSSVLGQYGTVEYSVREKFPVDLGLDHLYTDACPLRNKRMTKKSAITFAEIVNGCQNNGEGIDEEDIEEGTIEILDEAMQQSVGEEEEIEEEEEELEKEQDPTKIVFKNKTDQLWYERKGILNYTEKKEKMLREYAEEQRKKKEEDLREQAKYAARKKARKNVL